MGKEIVLLAGDSIQGPTGFANDLAGVSWCLAKDYEVHILGLQTIQNQKVKIDIENEQREVFQHANFPRTEQRFDFGGRALPVLLDQLKPSVFITVNDIQMICHVPEVMCPTTINMGIIDLPAKKFIPEYSLIQQLKGEVRKFKEKFPRNIKWIAYCPEDGDPPMPQWSQIYSMSDQVIAMAKYGQWVFKQWYGMDVPYIWHGVNTSLFSPRQKPKDLESKFIVGNLNRNQPRKQPVRCLEAFARFAADKPDALLHMQMDWNDEFGWPIEYFANMWGVLPKMITPLPVGMPRDEIAKIYSMWDLNYNCTGGEGFGLCHIEGMACGVPSLGCDYTTSNELIMEGEPGPRGSLVKCKDLYWDLMSTAAVRRSLVDIDDCVNVLNKYYYNRDLLAQHKKNSEIWAKKNVSWKVIQDKWKYIVEKTLTGEQITSGNMK